MVRRTRVNKTRAGVVGGNSLDSGVPPVSRRVLHRHDRSHYVGALNQLYNVLRKTKGVQAIRDFLSSSDQPKSNEALSFEKPSGISVANLPTTQVNESKTTKGGDNE